AARAHLDHIEPLIRGALAEAKIGIDQLDGIAAASGPGLIGGLIVGSMAAKGIAWATGKPFIAVNHLEAHALTARLSDDVPFPYLLLLVSGGHTSCWSAPGSAITASSAAAATMPPARLSTRPRSCSGSAIPAVRQSNARQSAGIH